MKVEGVAEGAARNGGPTSVKFEGYYRKKVKMRRTALSAASRLVSSLCSMVLRSNAGIFLGV